MKRRYNVILDEDLVARVRALTKRTGLDQIGGRISLTDALSAALKDWLRLKEKTFGIGSPRPQP